MGWINLNDGGRGRSRVSIQSDLMSVQCYIHFSPPQVIKYDRLSPIKVLNEPVETLDRLRPGDCIVCFNKNDIYAISRQIESKGMECAVIYGSLPPGVFSYIYWSAQLSVI